jgi:hypothetical protein
MRKISPFSSMLSAKTKRIKKEPVIKTRPSPSGYSISAHMPFACLSVSLIPKYRALPHQDLHILPIVSLRRLRVFYKQDKQIMLDFDQVTPGDANDWLSEECRLASDEAIGYLIGKAMKHLDDQVNVEISRLAE